MAKKLVIRQTKNLSDRDTLELLQMTASRQRMFLYSQLQRQTNRQLSKGFGRQIKKQEGR